uniref:Serine protease inhibitor n=1 Tax=Amblyomma americanum TaxID=6943 RepID=A0A0E9Y1V5_AMBAM
MPRFPLENNVFLSLSLSEDTNLGTSPVNVYLALAALMYATKGRTKKELLDVLHPRPSPADAQTDICDDDETTDKECDARMKVYEKVLALDEHMCISSGAFVDSRYMPLSEVYENVLRCTFGTDIVPMDMDKNADCAAVVNQWINDKTRGLITSKTQSDHISRPLMLINAVYFEAKWMYPFDPNDTDTGRFYIRDGVHKLVKMMKTEKSYVNRNVKMLLLGCHIGTIMAVCMLYVPTMYIGCLTSKNVFWNIAAKFRLL